MEVFERRRVNLTEILKSVSAADLARKSGVAASYISRCTKPPLDSNHKTIGEVTARKLEKGAKKPEGWMDADHATANITIPGVTVTATGSNQATAFTGRAGRAIEIVDGAYPVELSVPLLSWVRAGAFCEAPGQFTLNDADELLPRPLSRIGPNTFALTVVGDSMDMPDGYREGEIVYIDPDVAPTPGKDVLAKADGKMTLKRYKVDENGPYLLQLNGNKIIRPDGEWSVCGVVVYAGRKC